MFSYPLLKGNVTTALNSPLSLCISNKMAKEFFGSADAALGKTIRVENRKDFTVTGVFKDLPENASLKYQFLINWTEFLTVMNGRKTGEITAPITFIMLRENAKPQLADAKIRKFLDNYNKEQTASFRVELHMLPFGDKYLHSNFYRRYNNRRPD